MTINFNQPPYFDDYDEEKKFHKILFRPGYAVQTRELNQLQTILQKQVSRFGGGIYKEGAMVIPGSLAYKNNFAFVKLTGAMSSLILSGGIESETVISTPATIESIIISSVGKRVIGTDTGVQGTIKWYRLATENDPLTLYVEYDSAGTDGIVNTFANAEPITIRDTDIVSETDYIGHRVQSVAVASTGEGSVVEVERGVYFAKGNFVLVEPQTLLLDPYGTTPTYRVGFRVFESIVTPELDSTLSDNANGSFNFSAPGAHRHSIELLLHKLSYESSDDTDFVELLKVKDGNKESHVTRTEYSELAKELARRTYDESGDYAVTPFRMNATESRTNDRGEWVTATQYIAGDVVTRTITTIENDTTVTRVYTYSAVNSGASGFNGPTHTSGNAIDGTVTWSFEPYPIYNGGQSFGGSATKMTIAIEPGKAYVRGFEIEKLSTSFVEIDKARDTAQVNDDLIATTIGNYVLADTFIGIPDITTFAAVNLYRHTPDDNTIVGTARIRGLERDTEGGFRLYLMMIEMKPGFSFSRDVKTIGNTEFTCKLVDVNPTLGTGSVSVSGTAITGVGTNFTADFKINDYISVQGGGNFRITDVTSAELEIENPGSVAVSGAAYKLFLTEELDSVRTISIFPLGKTNIKSVRDESSEVPVVDTSYVIMQKANITTANDETSKTISLSSAVNSTGVGSAIDPNTELSEIIVARTGDGFVTPTSFTVSSDDTTFTIGGLETGTQYTVFFPVTKATPTTARFKTKTIQTYQTRDVTTTDAISARVIGIGKADVFRIRQILMAGTTGAITATTDLVDITDHFSLDNGQRDTHYDVASIVRKPSYGAPSGSIRIIFDFFTHSQTGDYFCADSYTNVLPENIPSYTSSNGTTYRLNDVLDFRPRISDAGGSFTGSGSALAMPPKPGTSTSVDYTYYMPRMDRISLDVNGQFVVTRGSSSDNPIPPETPSLTMNMAIVTLKPYTYGSRDVYIEKVDNRRYTMRDIGALEKRIDNLEYYTSLSLLEQEASSLQIQDEFGLNRYKNGFIVDNFTTHNVADATSNDYRAAIDTEARQLRPSFSMENVNLIEKMTPANRTGYQVTDDLVTLPYTETDFISQLYASRPENINPFAIFTFIGRADLNPPSDEWIETRRLPEVINDVEGNFSAVLQNAQSAGILGTQWNAWETNWTGTTTNDFWRGRALIRRTNEVTNQSRNGINTTVQATFSREQVGDRVVSTSVIPWIRSRHVVFLARSMRLNTVVYPFFDRTNISQYVTPASRIEFGGTNVLDAEDIDKFDFETNVGSENDEAARRFNGNVQTAYNKGDVIFVKQRGASVYASPELSPCTGVCVLQEVQPGGTTRSALVVNTTGSFQPGDIIGGTISGSEGVVVSFQLGEKGGSLMTNFGGDVAGVFDIPNTDAVRFATGSREFKLIDNLANSDLIARTRAHGNYRAQGTLQTWQATFNSVRNGEIVRNRISDSRSLTSVIGETVIGWNDPLAQTFLVQNKGGAFITSIDIWFASVDPVKPVTMQIREVVNGYPGKIILPFSSITLQPYQLRDENQPPGYGLSANRVMFEGTQYLAPDKPTKFTLRAPVYVQDLTEYCIVLISDSNNYHVWTSNLGEIDLTSPTPRLISEQPYAGVLFKSQNASTWTASQNEDLTFRINVAQFDQSGIAEFQNSRLGLYDFDENPFFTRNLSKLVRVFHPNHGFVPGSKVTISGVSNTASTNGISIVDLNKTHDILWVDQDTYVVRSSTTSNRTGRMGGTSVRGTYNLKFDTIHPIVQNQTFSDTALSLSVKTTSSRAVSGFQTPGVQSVSYVPVIANENNDFFNPQMVCSPDNEQLYLDGAKSLMVRVEMRTDNSYLSPVIDTSRFSFVTINNRIDAQTYEASNFIGESSDGDFDLYTLAANAFIAFSGNAITTDDADTRGIFRAQRPGKYLLISGSTNAANNGLHRIVSISADGSSITTTSTFTTESAGTQITVRIYDNFIDEAARDGSAISKYLTKRVDLSNSSGVSNNINIRFNADVPPSASVEIYYKVGLVASVTPFEDVEWTLYATQGVTQSSRDVSFDITGLDSFNAVAVKLVMKSTNSAAVPKVSDLIVVATA
jgi:hypothetical protein